MTIVLKNLTSPLNIIAYCAGFGIGVYIGSCLEQHLALGYVNVQVIVNCTDSSLPGLLREEVVGAEVHDVVAEDVVVYYSGAASWRGLVRRELNY